MINATTLSCSHNVVSKNDTFVCHTHTMEANDMFWPTWVFSTFHVTETTATAMVPTCTHTIVSSMLSWTLPNDCYGLSSLTFTLLLLQYLYKCSVVLHHHQMVLSSRPPRLKQLSSETCIIMIFYLEYRPGKYVWVLLLGFIVTFVNKLLLGVTWDN